jgi:hypothetical protein
MLTVRMSVYLKNNIKIITTGLSSITMKVFAYFTLNQRLKSLVHTHSDC